ncbi:MAG TPA: adenylosuccinate synthase [Flavobacteriales bacterium]|nr:adenylosuccinate synthase [Flavobacteriales bacterium]
MDVLLGAQWGDEGKGKVVDVIAPQYEVIARFQGGPNAGHTLIFEGTKHVLHTIPSGVFRPGTVNLVGNGVVVDPVIFLKEVRALEAAGVDIRATLLLSNRAHLILPTHRALDAASEADKGKFKIGSTLKGIGPTYMDKTGRNGLRVGDLFLPDLRDRVAALRRKHERLLSLYDHGGASAEAEAEWMDAVQQLKEFRTVDCEHYLDAALSSGKRVLAEGAQGTLLDIDFGTYPFVTSSSTICAGACTGLGVAPNRIDRITGIFKAYCTRVGSGPFPTELNDETGEAIRKAGHEFGSTTGRPRRCGWLDLPALRYAVMINGITELAMMKADVLNGMDTVRICTHYRVNGALTERMPYDVSTGIEPVYTDMPGWKAASADGQLPEALDRYITAIEQAVGVPITLISLGPDRAETILRQAAATA